jgi:hypothetical protein
MTRRSLGAWERSSWTAANWAPPGATLSGFGHNVVVVPAATGPKAADE